jgi:ankyrin repeat protein
LLLCKEDIVDLLLHNSLINKQYYDGNTALHIAVKTNHYDIVKKLINYNANVNIKNNFNETPICFASNYDIIKILLINKANPNYQDKLNNTLLHRIVKFGSIKCIKLLIHYQANPLIENYNKLNVIEYAKKQNNQKLVDLLVIYFIFIKKQYKSIIHTILFDNHQEKHLDNLILSFLI